RANPESLGAQPRWSVRTAAAAGGWGQELPEGRHHSDDGLSADLSAGADPFPRLRHDFDRGSAVRVAEHRGKRVSFLSDCGREHWPAGDPRNYFGWRLRNRTRRVVIEQQVFAFGLASLFSPVDQLRAGAGTVAGGRGDARRIAEFARDCREPVQARHSELESFRRLAVRGVFHLPDGGLRRNEPRAV